MSGTRLPVFLLLLSLGLHTGLGTEHRREEEESLSDFLSTSMYTNHRHLEDELRDHIGAVNLNTQSEEKLQFHFFWLHDFDRNRKLDGLEILAAMQESLPELKEEQSFKMEQIVDSYAELVDSTLKDLDVDGDGFVSYPEYLHVHRRLIGHI